MALVFACAVMLGLMFDLSGDPRCDTAAAREEAREANAVIECYEGSGLQQVVSQILGWPSAVIAAIAAFLAVSFAATGRRGQLALGLALTAIVLGLSSITVAAV